MRLIQRVPFRRKLTVISMLTSGVALLLACAAFTAFEVITFRRMMRSDLDRMARVISDSTASALTFTDPASAEQTLRSVGSDPHIMRAAVYDAEGYVFATFYRDADGAAAVPPRCPPAGYKHRSNALEYTTPIKARGKPIGSVYLASDLDALWARQTPYLAIAASVLVAASAVAFLLSRVLHRAISGPVLDLAKVATAVATKKNYALRATKTSDDELGRLIDDFNDMLAQIQKRDAELIDAREMLESRVNDRTRELQLEIAERKRSEQALRLSNERFEIVARATSDVIWDWDFDQDLMWRNENFRIVFGYDEGKAGPTSIWWLQRIHPDDAGPVLAGIQEVISSKGNNWTAEYRFRNAQGEYMVVLDRAYVLRDEQGVPHRMIGALQNITEQRRAEAELAQAHEELVAASRRAGQAEVATSVLHNAGNVLNSVIVSATLALERMKVTKIPNVSLAVKLLLDHRDQLGAFFEKNHKGDRLLEYLPQLGAALESDRQIVLSELTRLRTNIDHLKQIISVQQSYARAAGVQEMVPLAEIVDDAMALSADSLGRHGVQIERRYEMMPTFPIDRHTVLQILANLVSNAKNALEARPDDGKRMLRLCVHRVDSTARIDVVDNGVGIAPEDLTRIFQHGFTTRRDGHGFGLHSGALAAKQLGGSLSAHSDGRGKGATFTLEIPIPPASQ